MTDICSIFRYIEKEAQEPHVVIADILRFRDIAIQKLHLLEKQRFPGIQIKCYNNSKFHFEKLCILYYAWGYCFPMSSKDCLST